MIENPARRYHKFQDSSTEDEQCKCKEEIGHLAPKLPEFKIWNKILEEKGKEKLEGVAVLKQFRRV